MAESTFGRKAAKDWRFVKEIRGTRRIWPETEAKVRRFMATYRPDATARDDPQAQGAAA